MAYSHNVPLEALVGPGYRGWYLAFNPGTNRSILD